MTPKHTPGPWKVRKYAGGKRAEVVGAPMRDDLWSPLVAQMSFHPDAREEAIANAHIIAAALDILEALEGVNRFNQGKSDMPWELHQEQIDAAIAKVRGQS